MNRLVVATFALVCSLGGAAAQSAPTAPPVPVPDPLGLWTGTIACPAGANLPISVAIHPSGGKTSAIIFVPAQRFATDLGAVSMSGAGLAVQGTVPGGLPIDLRGPVSGSTWSATFVQGALTCPASLTHAPGASAAVLPIAPAYQTTPMWCWLAVGEMVFSTFSVPVPSSPATPPQCTIMQTIYRGSPNLGACAMDCGACAMMGAGSSREFAGMLTDYPRRRAAITRSDTPRLFATPTNVLSAKEMIAELDAGHPVVVGISPTGGVMTFQALDPFFPPMHVALVTGYLSAGSETWYRVNDPYPFPLTPAGLMSNPYVVAGALPQVDVKPAGTAVTYWIRDGALKTQLKWSESFLVRLVGKHRP